MSAVSNSPLVMMLVIIRTPRALVAAHRRSDRSYITGRFSSGSPPKKVTTSRSGPIRSISRSIQAATRAEVSSVIFWANLL